MENMEQTIPGQQPVKQRACYSLSKELLRELAILRRKHRVVVSEFIEDAAWDSLRRHSGRKPSPPQPAA